MAKTAVPLAVQKVSAPLASLAMTVRLTTVPGVPSSPTAWKAMP